MPGLKINARRHVRLENPGKLYNMLTNKTGREARLHQGRESMRKALLALLLAASATPAMAQGETFELKLPHGVRASHPLQKALEDWGAPVEKDSGGTIK